MGDDHGDVDCKVVQTSWLAVLPRASMSQTVASQPGKSWGDVAALFPHARGQAAATKESRCVSFWHAHAMSLPDLICCKSEFS